MIIRNFRLNSNLAQFLTLILFGPGLEDTTTPTNQSQVISTEECNGKFGAYICSGNNVDGWKGVSVESYQGCAEKCSTVTECKGWTYSKDLKKCWLKTMCPFTAHAQKLR